MRQENYFLLLKSFVNFLRHYPQSLDKIITLRLVNKIAQKIVGAEDLNVLALFYMVLTEFSKNNVSPKNYLSPENTTFLLDSLLRLFEKNDELRVFAYKQRGNQTTFKPFTP